MIFIITHLRINVEVAPTAARAGFLLGEAPQRARGARTDADGARIPRDIPLRRVQRTL